MKKYILIILVTLSVILIVFAQGNTKIDNIEYRQIHFFSRPSVGGAREKDTETIGNKPR